MPATSSADCFVLITQLMLATLVMLVQCGSEKKDPSVERGSAAGDQPASGTGALPVAPPAEREKKKEWKRRSKIRPTQEQRGVLLY
ncbi:hypothetical protein Y032_0017g3405 [Ancylostoma ceylanicum]|uniref:Secreted protein n=1 Tax=Ancylostoma ceylanicum TaxID=53326 RepID=A0A016V4F5_9BILA|nr:hypothetical protein Y032_0017g3405 [Ancylostoma ceylanicum]